MSLLNINIGDEVFSTGDSVFCDPSTEKVVDIKEQFDEKSGEKYKVIILSCNRLFDSRNGAAMNPPTAYYITAL